MWTGLLLRDGGRFRPCIWSIGVDFCRHGALYKKDDTAYLCWTYDPEVTYVLEYTPSKIDDSEVIKMAESAEPVK